MNKTIKVGILHGLLETWFNEIMVDFSKNSQHQLIVEVNTLDQLKEKLHNRKYDLIFTTENIQSELASSLKLLKSILFLSVKLKSMPRKLQTILGFVTLMKTLCFMPLKSAQIKSLW